MRMAPTAGISKTKIFLPSSQEFSIKFYLPKLKAKKLFPLNPTKAHHIFLVSKTLPQIKKKSTQPTTKLYRFPFLRFENQSRQFYKISSTHPINSMCMTQSWPEYPDNPLISVSKLLKIITI